ncbi:MAG TPA: M56 family metallopeptidase [Acidobacteriaceae bacterium]|nr:M56 family metallopeptidase [Acidobacteriaceae bacterium]
MEQISIEYLANALWQLPLLAGGAWLLLSLWKASPAMQHRVWLGVLALGLVMPLRGIAPDPASAAVAPSQPAVVGVHTGAYSVGEPAPGASLAIAADSTASVAESQIHKAGTQTAAAGYAAFLHRVRLNATAAACILALWLATALWGVFRLALAWTAARRLARTSRQVVLAGHEAAEVLECARRLGVDMPDVRESSAICGPVVVGAIRPVLLWPRGFRRHSGDEFKAALCHEIAHIRRRDYAMNLLCETVALPLRWHPAIHGVGRRIRATREMACDAMAARAMESEALYATCLLSLAQSMVGARAEHSLAAGLFNGNVMEERVMRLMQSSTSTSWRTRLVRGSAGVAAMTAAIGLAAAFHVVPAMAQAQTSAPAITVAPAAPVVSVNPVVKPVVRVRVVKPIVNLSTVKPVVNVTTVRPLVNVAEVRPFVHVSPVVNVSPVTVHIAPVVNPVIHIAPVAPIIQVAPPPPPAAEPPASQQKGAERKDNSNENHDHSSIVIKDGQIRDLTPAEKAQVEKELEDAQRRVAEATAKINSPEFRKQMEDAQRKALQAETMMNSDRFKKQILDAQRQATDMVAKMNSPEERRRIQSEIDAASKVNNAQFQKAISDAQASALRAQTMINSEQFRKQMADAQKQIAATNARLNSPEFKQQLDDAVRAAQKVNSAEIQKQMADAQKQIADALARMKADQTSTTTPQPAASSH